jgi:hypothetical protein
LLANPVSSFLKTSISGISGVWVQVPNEVVFH